MTSSIFSSESSKRPSVIRRPSDYLWEVEVDEEMPNVEKHPPPAAFGTTNDEDESQRSTSYKFVGPQTTRTLLLSIIPILFLIAGVVFLTNAFGQGHPGHEAMQNNTDHLSNNQGSIASADSVNNHFDHDTAEEGSQSVVGNMLPMYDGGTTYSGNIPAPAPTSSSADKPARPPSAGGNIRMYDNEKPASIGNTKTAGTVPASVSTPAKQNDTQQEEDMEIYDNSIVYDNELWQEYNGNTETAGTVPATVPTPAKGDTTNRGDKKMHDSPPYIGNTKTSGTSIVSPARTEEYNDSGDSRD